MRRAGLLFSRSRTRNATVMLTAAGVALASLPGCAFVFSAGPPLPARQAEASSFDCSESYVPPIVDSVLAFTAGIAASSAYSDRELANPHNVAAIEAGFSALFLSSAIFGYYSVSTCHSALAARVERRQREELLPPPYGMPPWGQPPPYWPPPVAFYRAPAPPVAPKEPPEPAVMPAPNAAPAPPAPGPPPATPPAAPVFKRAPPAPPPGS